jgi:exodeoxyribonuclease VII small subunit
MNGDDIESLTYETALLELDGIIERLERGAVALDEAIAAYERGTRLAQHCGALLDRTEQKISQLVVTGSGRQAEKPFEVEHAVPPTAAVSLTSIRRDRVPIDPDDIPF